MKARSRLLGVMLCACACAWAARAQQPAATAADAANEPRVALTEAATAYDAAGRAALVGRLRTTQLAGAQDAPLRNVLVVLENRSPFFYNYASGYVTFYGADGVRCGEGLWKLEAFAPGEQAEVDMPGLRLTCTPANWRLAALNLLTRPPDATRPTAAPAAEAAQPAEGATASAAPPRLEININGKTLPLQLDHPLDIVVGKERVVIVVRPAP